MKTTAKSESCCDPGERQATSKSGFSEKELARLAKALAHPARVRIVRALLKLDGCMCGDLVEMLPLAQSTVSQHLKVLKTSGVIQGAVEGPRRCYCVNMAALKRLKELLSNL